MNGFVQHFVITLRLHFRNRMALFYGFLFPLIFLAAFWALFRHEQIPLLLHIGELLTVTVLGGACFGLPTTLVNERERGVWLRYRLTPIAPVTLLFSTLLARFLIIAGAGWLQFGIALALGMTPPPHPLALLLVFLVVAFAFIGLGLVIAAVADSVPAVQALGQCMFLPMLILGGVAVPIGSLPAWAQQFSTFLPGRYAVESLQNTMNGQPLATARFDLLALALIGATACFAGAKLFRWSPGETFRSISGKAWLVPAFATWVLVGAFAHSRSAVESSTSSAAGGVTAPPTESSGPPPTAAPAQPWGRLTEGDIDALNFSVPPDEGRVTPIARDSDVPDEETDLMLARFEGELPHWGPGRVEDPIQRVRNLLSVAAVADLLQHPLERFIPRLVQQRLELSFSEDRLVRVLSWIALHPDEGTIITNISDLNIEGSVSEAVARERLQLYAIKLIARISGRATTQR